MMTRVIATLAALLTALCFATGALAHAALVSAEPADGSVLAQSPKTLQLRFSESVTPGAINLIDAAGKTRDVAARADGRTVVVALPDDLPDGTQVVSYRVVSQDGHPVAGSLMFSIRVVTGGTQPSSSVVVPVLIWLFRFGVYLGLFVGVGGVFFASWIGWGPSGARAIIGALRIGLVSAVASLGLQGLDLLNLPLGGLFSLAPWKGAFGTSLGPSLLIAIASMLVARLGWQAPSMSMSWKLTATAMAGVGLSLSTSSHAATASPEWVTGPAVFVHGVAAAFWIGALAPLLALSRNKTGALPVLLRFSRVAVPVVGALVVCGVGLAIVQLGSFAALIDTRYGIILLVKLVLVALLLGFAALNRYLVTPALVADPGHRRPLKAVVFLECVTVLLILGVVAGWRFTPPPRALAAAAQAAVEAPLAIHIHAETAMFQVLISPGKVGSDDFVLQLMAGDASPLRAKEATLTLSLPERGVEPIERKAALGPDGYWHLRGVPLPLPGRWHMRIGALVTDFEKVTLEDDFEVR
jgi:copper transport protein